MTTSVNRTLFQSFAPLLMLVMAAGCADISPHLPSGVSEPRYVGDCRRDLSPRRYANREGMGPSVPTVEQAFSNIKAALQRRGIRIAYWRECPGGLLGRHVPAERRILLCPQEARDELTALAHEAGHVLVRILLPKIARFPGRVREVLAEVASARALLELRLISNAEADARLHAIGVMPHEVDGVAALAVAVSDAVVGWAVGAPDRARGVAYGY